MMDSPLRPHWERYIQTIPNSASARKNMATRMMIGEVISTKPKTVADIIEKDLHDQLNQCTRDMVGNIIKDFAASCPLVLLTKDKGLRGKLHVSITSTTPKQGFTQAKIVQTSKREYPQKNNGRPYRSVTWSVSPEVYEIIYNVSKAENTTITNILDGYMQQHIPDLKKRQIPKQVLYVMETLGMSIEQATSFVNGLKEVK